LPDGRNKTKSARSIRGGQPSLSAPAFVSALHSLCRTGCPVPAVICFASPGAICKSPSGCPAFRLPCAPTPLGGASSLFIQQAFLADGCRRQKTLSAAARRSASPPFREDISPSEFFLFAPISIPPTETGRVIGCFSAFPPRVFGPTDKENPPERDSFSAGSS